VIRFDLLYIYIISQVSHKVNEQIVNNRTFWKIFYLF